jgi:hypothetical protein
MNSNPLYILSDDEKIEIERLVQKKLAAEPNSDICKIIDKKVQSMESHIKHYFHMRVNFHQEKK